MSAQNQPISLEPDPDADELTAEQALKDVLSGKTELPEFPDRDQIPKDSLYPITTDDLALLPQGTYVEPWAQEESEPDETWIKFLHYRDLGGGRTLAQTADHFGDSVRTVEGWSAAFRWSKRAAAWDNHLDRVYRLKLQGAIRDMADRHSSQVMESLMVLALPFQALAERAKDPDFIEELGALEIRRLFDIALGASRAMPTLMSAERLARGMPTEITEVQGTVDHDHRFDPSPDQVGAILAILEGNGAFPARIGTDGFGTVIEAEVVSMDDEYAVAEPVGVFDTPAP